MLIKNGHVENEKGSIDQADQVRREMEQVLKCLAPAWHGTSHPTCPKKRTQGMTRS